MYTTSACETPFAGCIQAAAGSSSSELVQTFASRLFTLAHHITQNDQDAERVLTEAFLQLCCERLACEEQDLWVTLVTIAVREAFSALHQQAIGPNLGPGLDSSEDLVVRELSAWRSDLEEHYPKQPTTQVLEAGLQRLDPMTRTVFVLRDMEQISIERIAEILNRSVPAIEVCLLRARLQLRENLARHMRLLQ